MLTHAYILHTAAQMETNIEIRSSHPTILIKADHKFNCQDHAFYIRYWYIFELYLHIRSCILPSEHMEEDEKEEKTLPEWVELEYLVRQIALPHGISIF